MSASVPSTPTPLAYAALRAATSMTPIRLGASRGPLDGILPRGRVHSDMVWNETSPIGASREGAMVADDVRRICVQPERILAIGGLLGAGQQTTVGSGDRAIGSRQPFP